MLVLAHRRLTCVLLSSFIISTNISSAQVRPSSRIVSPIDERVRLTLKGNVHPLATPQNDMGRVPDTFAANRLMIWLQRPPAREAALRQFVQDAHTPNNSRYHKWLTPAQFGNTYGPDAPEVAAVSGWLQKHGFAVKHISAGKTAIEFSGNAGQIRSAFSTEIHAYMAHGVMHYANNQDPQIPAALAPVIAGVGPMNNFHPLANAISLGKAIYDPATHKLAPQWTILSDVFALDPGDFAVQYDLNPLYNAGINGTGVTIGIIGAADVDPTVFANYRSFFGLVPGTLNAVIDGTDPTPGQGNWATGESYLDVEIAGGVAPGAIINLYTAADTSVQSGLILAAQRAVDDDQAAVLSMSYGICEASLGTAGNQFFAQLWEQAAAQGQTVFVSAGDNGSAGCDDFNQAQAATHGLAVNGFASTPWNVAVGGTDFFYSTYNGSSSAQQSQFATYWNSGQSYLPATSLMQPIPEQPWNRAFGLNLYDAGVYDPNTNGPTIVAGSGGASSIYAKPAWQSGSGVPADRKRDLPDISLFAAPGENNSFYPICMGNDCVALAGGNYTISAVGGTSASSPAMAGIMALVNQKYGRQGQANFVLYPLATQHPNIFHDVTISSNNVPCQGGPGCSVSSASDNTKGFQTLGHYYSTAHYDQATGLGSIDANLLVQNWNSLSFTPSNTTLTLSQTSFTHGTPVNLSVGVTGTGGTPSGDVGLVTTATPSINTSLGELTLQGGTATTTVNNLPGGQYQLTGRYTGDTVFAPSNSVPISLDVSPEASTVSISAMTINTSGSFVPVSNGASYPYGTYLAIDAQPQGINAPQGSSDGLATGTISFADSASGGNVTSSPLAITSQGVTEWVPALAFPVGQNSITANYSGDASFKPSSSIPLTFTITKLTPFGFLDAKPSPVALGSPTTLELEIDGLYSAPQPPPPDSTFNLSSPVSPTGTVTFSYGNTVLGTVATTPEYNNLFVAFANLNVSSLPSGTDTITASYSGDGNYNPKTYTFNVVVLQAAMLSAVASPSTITSAEYSAVTATLAPSQNGPVPTGTVTFSVPPGGFHWWTDTETLSNGVATSVGIPGVYLGSNSVDVYYNGDSNYGPADVTTSFNVIAGGAPFALAATAVTIASPGANTGNSSTVTVTPQNSFTGPVYLSCSLTSSPAGAQHLPTCTIPTSVSIPDTNAVTATMTIQSTPNTIGELRNSFGGRRWMAMNGMVLFGGVILLGVPLRRRRFVKRWTSLMLLVALGSLSACGGGANTGGGGGKNIPGTTPGNYTFTVRAALGSGGVAQAQAQVNVTIQ